MTRRRALLVGGLTATTALGLVAAWQRGQGDVLSSERTDATLEQDDSRTGQVYEIGLNGFMNTGKEPVRFVDVRPVGMTSGLVVERVRAVNNCGRGQAVIGVQAGSAEQVYPDLALHPVTDAVTEPRQWPCWYLLLAVRVTGGGMQAIDEFELVYRVDGRTERHRLDYGVQFNVTGPGPDPRMFEPAPLDPLPPPTPTPTPASGR